MLGATSGINDPTNASRVSFPTSFTISVKSLLVESERFVKKLKYVLVVESTMFLSLDVERLVIRVMNSYEGSPSASSPLTASVRSVRAFEDSFRMSLAKTNSTTLAMGLVSPTVRDSCTIFEATSFSFCTLTSLN